MLEPQVTDGNSGVVREEKTRVLVVDDEEGVRFMLGSILGREGYAVTAADSANQALAEFERQSFDILLSDIRMPGFDGLALVDEIRRRKYDTIIIVMSAFGTRDTAIEAISRGANDYIAKPFKPDEIILTLRKVAERQRLDAENLRLRRVLAEQSPAKTTAIVTAGGKMAAILATAVKIAEHKTTVLLTGESGTGKELVARAIHTNSPRAGGPFVAVNCGAIPENLLESELFGHKKGAFTDATHDKKGLFEEANKGTIFLDEIGELPLSLQVKLLRVLQEEEIRPVGDNVSRKINVRVVAATARNLKSDTENGKFREDLYYRLNVFELHLPPLRERPEDLPILIEHFIEKQNNEHGTHVHEISPEVKQLLLEYSWPGNVRQLENVIERSLVLTDSARLEATDLPNEIRNAADPLRKATSTLDLSVKKATRILEIDLIRRALQMTKGNRTHAAKLLELSPRALLYKIKEYEIK